MSLRPASTLRWLGTARGDSLLARRLRPSGIILDIRLPGLDGWEFLARAKDDPEIADVPVIIVSMVDERGKGLALGAADYLVKPVARQDLLEALARITPLPAHGKVLAIDDDPIALELVRAVLEPVGYAVLTARSAGEGVALARAELPDVVLLDLVMPDVDGFAVVDQLKDDPVTGSIPIVILTSKTLGWKRKAAQRTDRPSCAEGRVRSIRPPRADSQIHGLEDTLSGTTAAGLILIVEDNERNLKLIRIFFSTTDTRRSRLVMPRTASRSRPSAGPISILMDIQLPDADGVTALGRLRADGRTASIGVVALTAFAMTNDRERLLRAGFDGYLEKRIDVRAFPGQVLALLHSTRPEPIG